MGLELLTAVVEEFSPSTASQMGLSWWALLAGPPARCGLRACTRCRCFGCCAVGSNRVKPTWVHATCMLLPCLPPPCRRELHEQCRSSLEQGYLHGLLLHAQASAREAAPAAASGADGGMCVAALRLLGAILGWPFSSGEGFQCSTALVLALTWVYHFGFPVTELLSAMHVLPPYCSQRQRGVASTGLWQASV